MGVHFKENEDKITMGMIISGIVIIAILVTSLIVYLININNSTNQGEIASQEEVQTGDSGNGEDDFETVSIDIGKSVNEVKNEMQENVAANASETNKTSTNNTGSNTNTNKSTTNSISKKTENKEEEKEAVETTEKNAQKEEKKEVKFTAPVKGEILREFAKDSLVYSNTLEEWVTHNGIDVKADKTTVVKSASQGTVYAIKNDPRYGLTVIVNHADGYQTVYANLLTAEYVVEGENIEEGQTIGTVGNSSAFEISDDYHLHFELLKDGEYLNPSNFMEF